MKRQWEFDFGKGERLRDDGMAKARGRQSNFEFNHAASQFFFALNISETFTPDDLIRRVGLPDEGANRNNAVGAWINGMAKAGYIRWTGKVVKSERSDRHAGMNKEWIKIKG